jgi:HD superfamily phosphohydrolase
VSEGTIGADRIIKMLDIRDGRLVVEEKGIYSIENFLSARRLMYWQVYLHKTSVASEKMMIQLIKRAKWLVQNGIAVKATPAFSIFLERNISLTDLQEDPDLLDVFASLDDYDIWGSVKFWTSYDDKVLSMLSTMLLQRKLFQIVMSNDKIEKSVAEKLKIKIQSQLGVSEQEASYFIGKGSISNKAYIAEGQTINILTKAGQIVDVATASDLPNIKAMSKIVTKHYLCWPKIVSL